MEREASPGPLFPFKSLHACFGISCTIVEHNCDHSYTNCKTKGSNYTHQTIIVNLTVLRNLLMRLGIADGKFMVKYVTATAFAMFQPLKDGVTFRECLLCVDTPGCSHVEISADGLCCVSVCSVLPHTLLLVYHC